MTLIYNVIELCFTSQRYDEISIEVKMASNGYIQWTIMVELRNAEWSRFFVQRMDKISCAINLTYGVFLVFNL